MTTSVKTIQLKKTYDLGKTKVHALRGVDITVRRGAFVTIAGPSGSGKSTLLSLLGCLDRPSSGEVWIEGRSTGGLGERDRNRLRLRTLGFVFQSFNLIPVLNVYENIELPLLVMPDVSPRERRKRPSRAIVVASCKTRANTR